MTKVAVVFGDEDFDMSPYPGSQLVRIDETKFFSIIAERIGLINTPDPREMPKLIMEAFKESASTEGPVCVQRIVLNIEPVVLAVKPNELKLSQILRWIWDIAVLFGVKTEYLTNRAGKHTQATAQ